jgi:anhydro-N-acetylmuramic acid kinase
MPQLLKLINKEKRKVIGLMSGTSCDGVDLALVEINGSGIESEVKFLHGYNKPYTTQQKQSLLQLMDPNASNVKLISQANFYLAQIWAKAINELLKKVGENYKNIDLIGSHGQTIYHQPNPESLLDRDVTSTLQIGDPSALAQLTGITTVGDFRIADVALKGQGAPLVPYFDWLIFSKLKANLLSLNIGGIANITYVAADGDINKVRAFDTGPGNMLIDQLMQRLYEVPFDQNGQIAQIGTFSDRLFNFLSREDLYPDLVPPKSTGREHYGPEFVIKLLRKALRWRIQEPDIIHTVTKYTAYTIWEAYRQFIKKEIEYLYISGGGSHNKFLFQTLQEYFKDIKVKVVDGTDMDVDYKEAICFAVLAHECLNSRCTNLPEVTGATDTALLGKICPAE